MRDGCRAPDPGGARGLYLVPVPASIILQRRVGAILVLVASAVLLVQFTAGGDSRSAASTTATTDRGAHAIATAPRTDASRRESPQARLDRAVSDVLSHSSVVTRGGGKKRLIALTFDDGPGPYTPKVLIALNRLKVKATFFVVGRQENTFHAATMAEIHSGHVVGDHTDNHPHLARLATADQYGELLIPMQWLSKYGLPRPLLFRPPYGSYNQATLGLLKPLKMLTVLWTVDSQDYNRPGIIPIVRRVVSDVKPGAIVLLHDGGGDRSQTVKAIPMIVRRLRAKHYKLVTVPELLRDDPPPPGRKARQLRSEG